jgi:hypothetical protein
MARRLLAAFAAFGLCAVAPSAASALEVQIVNGSTQPSSSVYVMLHGGSSSDGQLQADQGVALSSLKTDPKTGHPAFQLQGFFSGRIYVSYGAKVTNGETHQSPTRFDKVELTSGTPTPTANLTAVDFFGIPFNLEAFDGSRSLGRRTMPYADGLFGALAKVGSAGATVRAGGKIVRVLSPQLAPSAYGSMDRYVRAMAGQTVTLHGAFFGSPFTTYAYSGTFAPDGAITLNGTYTTYNGPTPVQSNVPGLPLAVAGPDLVSSIYPAAGRYTVGGRPPGENDLYAAMYTQLMSGFAWGYWGGRWGNDTLNWCTSPDPRGFCLTGFDRPAFSAARTSAAPFTPAFNQYADVIYSQTGAYGFAYADTGKATPLLALNGATVMRVSIVADRAPVKGAALDDAIAESAAVDADDDAVRVGTLKCPPACGTAALRATAELDGERVVVGRGQADALNGEREPLELQLTRAGQDALDDGALDVRVRATVTHPNGHVTRIVDRVRLRPDRS